MTSRHTFDTPIYLITDRHSVTVSGGLFEAVELAVQGGVRAVQFRELDMDDTRARMVGIKLKRICDRNGAKFFVNRRISLAIELGADGLHFGIDGLRYIPGLRKSNPDMVIGVTCGNHEDIIAATTAGADFVTLGPAFKTSRKGKTRTFFEVEDMAAIIAQADIPVYAIGGINTFNVSELTKLGVRRLALSHAILDVEDPKGAAMHFMHALKHWSADE